MTERLASAVSKMWIVDFISTALLLLVINARIKSTSKIFGEDSVLPEVSENSAILNGEYDDFYAEWYGYVGVYIVVSEFFAAIFPWANFMFWLVKGLGRCRDRDWTQDMKKTRAILQ